MEERILKIIRKPIFPKTVNGEKLNCDAQEAAAKEITDLIQAETYPKEFVEWLKNNCDHGHYKINAVPYQGWITPEEKDIVKSTDGAYDVWLKEVKNK